ncbi:MAG TPA: VWA domain-containing protein, partial [Thermomicrobiales bacterium]|nr:VWA domain-containing protein [Thermomicrobiales bacterium]
MSISFAQPQWFWLLLALPLLGWAGWRFGVRGSRLPRAAFWLRLATFVLLVLAIAQPLLASGAGRSSTVFVVDRSRSLADETTQSAEAWVDAASATASPADRAAVVTFGADPALAAPATGARQLDPAWTQTAPANPDYTDIGSALALARALPLGGARRIVLLSDGAENVGRALDQAAQAAADGIPIDVVPLAGVGAGDLRIDG